MPRNSRYVLIGLLLTITYTILTIPLANAAIGTGQLYVYTNPEGEAPKEGPKGDTYFVSIGVLYHIRVWNITEFNTGELLTVKICWTATSNTDQTTFFYDVPVNEESRGIKYVEVSWIVPSNAKLCTTSTVHYTQKPGPDYVAAGQVSNIGHMHIIPQSILGTIGIILALFGAFGIFMFHKIKCART